MKTKDRLRRAAKDRLRDRTAYWAKIIMRRAAQREARRERERAALVAQYLPWNPPANLFALYPVEGVIVWGHWVFAQSESDHVSSQVTK